MSANLVLICFLVVNNSLTQHPNLNELFELMKKDKMEILPSLNSRTGWELQETKDEYDYSFYLNPKNDNDVSENGGGRIQIMYSINNENESKQTVYPNELSYTFYYYKIFLLLFKDLEKIKWQCEDPRQTKIAFWEKTYVGSNYIVILTAYNHDTVDDTHDTKDEYVVFGLKIMDKKVHSKYKP